LISKKKYSIYRACKVINLSNNGYYYKTKRTDDSAIITALNKQVEAHPQEGFWLSFYRFKNQGKPWNHKRVWRVYKEMGLSLRRKKKKRLPSRVKEELAVPSDFNDTWSIDFTTDILENKRKFRTFNVMDDYNREALYVEVDYSLPSKRVVYVLNRLTKQRGSPKRIRMDNGPEFISNIMKGWCDFKGIELKYIQPGKPTQNAYIERLNRTYRESVLDAYLFANLDEVRQQTEVWINDYNYERPHNSIGNIAPKQYADIDLLKTLVPRVYNKSTSKKQHQNNLNINKKSILKVS
jgi:putative transposase